MTEEDNKSIEYLMLMKDKLDFNKYGFVYGQDTIDTVLNLIQKLQEEKEIHIKLEQQYKKEYLDVKKEVEKYKYSYQKALDSVIESDRENIRKDKIIDFMAEELENQFLHCEPCWLDNEVECKNYSNCIDCIKQYFKNKAIQEEN